MCRPYPLNGGKQMTYSSYLNDKELRAAADRYTEMYGGQFECADTGDVLLYRKNE